MRAGKSCGAGIHLFRRKMVPSSLLLDLGVARLTDSPQEVTPRKPIGVCNYLTIYGAVIPHAMQA